MRRRPAWPERRGRPAWPERRGRRIVLLAALLLVLGACGDGQDANDAGAGRSTSAAPGSSAPSSTTPGPSSTTTPPLRYDRLATPAQVGSGFIDGASPDGSALYVEEVDPARSPRGCEGQPEPFLYRLPVAGGAREMVGPPGEPLRGLLLRGQGGRIAVVTGCEEFLSSVKVGTETADGRLRDLKKLDLAPSSPSPFSGAFGWSADGTFLLGARTGTPPTVNRIDPATGAASNLFPASGLQAVSQVGQLADGTYVVAGDGVVTTRDQAGTVKVRLVASGFELAPDRRRMAIYGDGLTVLSLDQGAPTVLLAPDPEKRVFTARFSPDGQALVLTRDAGEDVEVSVIRSSGGSTPVPASTRGRLVRAYFTGDGRAIAYNLLTMTTNPPAANATVFVSRFE